tara:strand:+ start:996 stop:1544 length:549 start_codon:yes stop_codon:yes gene_type:complete
MKKQSKITRIFKHIQNTPKLTYKELITFICNMNGREYQKGYYSDALSTLRHRGRFYTNKKGYVKLTALGKKMIDTPFAKTPKEKEKDKERKQYVKIRREVENHLRKEEKRNVRWNLEKIEERGHVETIGELIYFLKSFDSYDKIELSVDEEGNAFGKIHWQVFYDELEGWRNKVTLVPLVRY